MNNLQVGTFALFVLLSSRCIAVEIYTSGGIGFDYCQVALEGDSPCGPFSGDLESRWISHLASNPISEDGLWLASAMVIDEIVASDLIQVVPGTNREHRVVPLDRTTSLRGLAIDPTDGSFYGHTEDSLVSIDIETGEVQAIGAFDALAPSSTWSTLAFDNGGVLYGAADLEALISTLVKIDKLTGFVSSIAATDARIQGLAFHPSTNELYSLSYGTNDAGTTQYGIFRVDVTDGSTEFIGQAPIRASGLTFANVPEPGLTVWIFLLLAVLGIRRRG